jgi:hypothetical protein
MFLSEDNMNLYKVFDKRLVSPYQNYRYKIGEKYHCDDFDEDKSEDCSRGFYAVDIEGLPYCFNVHRDVYEVKVWGKKVEIDQYKRRYENIEIIRKCTHEEIKSKAMKIDAKLGYKLSEVLFPFNPLTKKTKLTDEHIELLKQWDSVWDSVWDGVWDSVGVSVGVSVGASVWASVWVSVGAYISSLFPDIKKWKYIDRAPGVNPFQPCIDLWYAGIVPSYDGKTWRLHSGKKAEIIWEGKI